MQTRLNKEFVPRRNDPCAWDSGGVGILEAEKGGGHEAEGEDD